MTYKRKEVIGDCTLYLGDSCEVVSTVGAFDTLITDPPYGMEFRSNYRQTAHDPIANDDSADCLLWACELPAAHSRYIFCRWDNLAEVPKPKSCITWVKNNWSMGDLEHEHARQTEIILFYPGIFHKFAAGRPTDVVMGARTSNEHHPTEKPFELMRKVIGWTEGVVLDPFMGSGTTLVACAKMGRKGIGIELDQGYFDIACRRVEEAYSQPDLFIKREQTPAIQGLLPW